LNPSFATCRANLSVSNNRAVPEQVGISSGTSVWLLNPEGFAALYKASGCHQGKAPVTQMRLEEKKTLYCSFCEEIKTHIIIQVFYFMGTASKRQVSRTGSRRVIKRSGINSS